MCDIPSSPSEFKKFVVEAESYVRRVADDQAESITSLLEVSLVNANNHLNAAVEEAERNMLQISLQAVESCEARIFNQICSAMDIRLREIAASIEQRMQAQQDEAIERVVEAAEGRSSNHSEALRLVNELITTRVSNVSAELSVNLDTRVAALADAQNDRVQDVGHALEVKLEKWEAQQRETIRLLRDNLRDVDAKTGTMMMRMDALALAVESAQLKVASHASQQSDTTLAQTHAQFQVDELVTELQSQKERTAASMVAIHSSLRTLEDRLNIGSANAVREIREAETRCTAVLQTCRDLLARAKGTAEAAVGTVVAPLEERLRCDFKKFYEDTILQSCQDIVGHAHSTAEGVAMEITTKMEERQREQYMLMFRDAAATTRTTMMRVDALTLAVESAQLKAASDASQQSDTTLAKIQADWEAQQRETIRLLRDNLRDVDAKTGTMMMRMDALTLAVESAQLKVASHASQQSDTTLAQTHAQFQVDELVTELQSQKERTAASMVAIHSSLRTLEDRLNIGSANAVREIREAETRCTAVLQTCRDLLARAKGTAEAAVGTVVAPHEERLRYELVCNANSAAQQAVTSVKQGCEVLISPRQDATVITNAGVVHRHNIFANSTPQASRSLPQPQPRTATPRVANPGQVTRLQSARAIATAEQERRADERAQALSEAAALRRRNRK
jgi:hypothetical protein